MQGLVTVFGGSGFVGAQVVRALAKTGARVRVAVRNPGRGYRLRMLGDVGQIEVVQANIREGASVARALEGAEGCVNAVAVLYQSGRQTFEALHVEGARLIAAMAAEAGVTSFVQISALGASASAASAYARTKAAGEAAVRAVLPGAVILRPSVIFGPEDAFFNRFAAMAMISPALPLIGGGKSLFQPVYVSDVAQAVARALASPAAEGKTFELGGPMTYSFEALIALMLNVIQRRRTLVPVPFPVADLLGQVGDLAAVLGVPPPITRDQVTLLRSDNIVAPGAMGLAELGVPPSALEPILPSYLYVYRPGGQYAERVTAAPGGVGA
jgi:NADH dehydrogenase